VCATETTFNPIELTVRETFWTSIVDDSTAVGCSIATIFLGSVISWYIVTTTSNFCIGKKARATQGVGSLQAKGVLDTLGPRASSERGPCHHPRLLTGNEDNAKNLATALFKSEP
jgi:hypothetical protein